MKKFHKYGLLIVLALILALCISVFAACTPEQDTTGLTNAKAYLKAQLINEPVSTPGDYTRPSALRNEQGSYTVVWTVSITSGPQTVTIVDNGDGTVTVDVQESAPGVNEDTLYTLTATITDANGNTDTLSFNHKIPKFVINTFADYVAADKETDLVMEGIVTGILPKGNGASNDGYYMNTLDGEGGVYVYGTSGADLTVGQTVRVKGQKDNYSGTLELKNSTHEIINSEITAVTPVDFTAIYTAAENLKAEDLVAKQALLVTIKGVTIDGVSPTDNSYYLFSLADKQSYVRISSSSCPMTTEKQTAFKTSYNAHIGYTADVTGVICVYDGKFYLTPVDEDAFSNFVAPQKSDAELVADVKDSLTIGVETIFTNKEIELPTAGTGLYADVAISWELATNACATLEANVLSVVLPEEATELTLTATISKGEATETKEFTIAVSAKPKTVNVVVDAPVNGGEYYFMLTHTNLENKNFFITGEMDTFYYATTEDITAAVKVKVIEVSAGQYQLKVGAKYLDIVANGTHTNVVFVEEAPTKNFTWNADLKTFVTVVNETAYFYGTSATKTFTTLSACKVEYASSNCIAHLVDWVADPNASKEEEEEPAETITTIEGALAGTDGTAVELSGTVSNGYYDGVSFYISDGTNEILVYSPAKTAYVGDIVTVVGTLGSHDGTKQIAKNATVTINTTHTCSYADATCLKPATCTSCGATTGEALGHIDENSDLSCDRCTANLDPSVYEYIFEEKQFSANGTVALGSVEWTLSGNGNYWGYDNQNGRGQQFGSGSKPYTSLTLESASFNNVTSITVNTSGASSIAGTLTVYVGDTQVGEAITLTSTATDYTVTASEPLTGAVKLVFSQTSSKAIYVLSITVDTEA